MAKPPRAPRAAPSQPKAAGRRAPVNAAGAGRADPAAPLWTWGRHAVAAALANPARPPGRLLLTRNAAQRLAADGLAHGPFEEIRADGLTRLLPCGAVHQGAALQAPPPPALDLQAACLPPDAASPVVVIDQVSDPQNIGAIFRAAAAFGARAVVVHDRKTPPLAGALAKAAAGAVDALPHVRAGNIAEALARLGAEGYVRIGLAGEAEAPLAPPPQDAPIVLVVGAEGAGLRRLTRERCDRLMAIPVSDKVESLNVAAATAVALYALRR